MLAPRSRRFVLFVGCSRLGTSKSTLLFLIHSTHFIHLYAHIRRIPLYYSFLPALFNLFNIAFSPYSCNCLEGMRLIVASGDCESSASSSPASGSRIPSGRIVNTINPHDELRHTGFKVSAQVLNYYYIIWHTLWCSDNLWFPIDIIYRILHNIITDFKNELQKRISRVEGTVGNK